MMNFFTFLFAFFFSASAEVQGPTVGLMVNTPEAYDGYTLLAGRPNRKTTYLIDNCGRIVHTWPILKYPANLAYLNDDGYLVRLTAAPPVSPKFPNDWGRVEMLDWDGNLVWEYTYCDSNHLLHHDVESLPNGNMLILAYELMDENKLRDHGKKNVTPGSVLWSAQLLEIKPVGKDSGVVVWEWHAWDHLVQDHDQNKSNYGNVSAHPELMNINYPEKPYFEVHDWLHINSLDYNPQLDQVLLSVRHLNEIWIIDHSTTTKEAASHQGGRSARGGDILYRWGNPEAYGRGDSTARQLFFQHDAGWIPASYPGAGNIILFNNGLNRPGEDYSTVVEIKPPLANDGKYNMDEPASLVWEYKATVPASFFSANISSVQRLPNGNTLIDEGVKGNVFEVDHHGRILWKYIFPVRSGTRLAQGEPSTGNLLFSADKYPVGHKAFKGRSLKPEGYIELNPVTDNCK